MEICFGTHWKRLSFFIYCNTPSQGLHAGLTEMLQWIPTTYIFQKKCENYGKCAKILNIICLRKKRRQTLQTQIRLLRVRYSDNFSVNFSSESQHYYLRTKREKCSNCIHWSDIRNMQAYISISCTDQALCCSLAGGRKMDIFISCWMLCLCSWVKAFLGNAACLLENPIFNVLSLNL